MINRLLLSLLTLPLLLQAAPKLQRVGGDFKRPIHLTSLPNDANLLFIVEQAGKVYLHEQASGKTHEKPFLDISSEVSRRHNEEGLLGFTLGPNYTTTGRVYLNFSNHDRVNEIVRYTVKNPAKDLSLIHI